MRRELRWIIFVLCESLDEDDRDDEYDQLVACLLLHFQGGRLCARKHSKFSTTTELFRSYGDLYMLVPISYYSTKINDPRIFRD